MQISCPQWCIEIIVIERKLRSSAPLHRASRPMMVRTANQRADIDAGSLATAVAKKS
jgi:hypothetical protein